MERLARGIRLDATAWCCGVRKSNHVKSPLMISGVFIGDNLMLKLISKIVSFVNEEKTMAEILHDNEVKWLVPVN